MLFFCLFKCHLLQQKVTSIWPSITTCIRNRKVLLRRGRTHQIERARLLQAADTLNPYVISIEELPNNVTYYNKDI